MCICVVGAGYVGLATATCFAELGNQVMCLDVDEAKIHALESGRLPIFEPGLEEMVRRNVAAGRLRFTTSYEDALKEAQFAFIAVGTPSGVDGEADLQHVRAAVEAIADSTPHSLIIVNKSTVPVGTGDWVSDIVKRRRVDLQVAVVSNPEFLREGSAIADFLHPDRIVLGSEDQEAARLVAQLYSSLRAPLVVTNLRTAEMIKYASNCFLATRVSFINEVAAICEELGADVKEVATGMGYDKRIGASFLDAGIGWGGSCFPKDVKALAYMAVLQGTHPQLLQAVMDINRNTRRRVVMRLRKKLGSLEGKQIAIWGLAFKPDTDDVRESPAIELIRMLENEGASVRAYDPQALANAAKVLPAVGLCRTPYEAAADSDAVIVATAWNELKNLDMQRVLSSMKGSVIVDGRNVYEPESMRAIGFDYYGIGRGYAFGG